MSDSVNHDAKPSIFVQALKALSVESLAKMTVPNLKAKILELSGDESLKAKTKCMKKSDLVAMCANLVAELSQNKKINEFMFKRSACAELPPAKKQAL